jgi:hypothetical protein
MIFGSFRMKKDYLYLCLQIIKIFYEKIIDVFGIWNAILVSCSKKKSQKQIAM